MVDSEVRELLGAVRGRLWRGQFVAAARKAMWASAAMMLLAVALHLGARRVPVEAVLMTLFGTWVSLLVWAAWQRPADAACALWADRNLGGASAFTTLLELDKGTQKHAHASALRWLQNWASARVPHGRRLLAERQESMRLSRPLLSLMVCTTLATVVLSMPHTAPAPGPQAAASSPSGIGDAALPGAQPPASAELVGEIANALQSTASRGADERRQSGRASAPGRGRADEGKAPLAARVSTTSPGERADTANSSPGTTVDAARTAATAQTTGTGSGREAGDSRDDRSEAGVSRVLQGTIAMQRSMSSARRPTPDMQADMDRLGAYDEDLSMPGSTTMHPVASPAAATPPPAAEAARLTPSETTYVQAWMKASARRR